MIKRGDWVPLLPLKARTVVVGILPVEPLVRGIDYTLPGKLTSVYSVVEKALPSWVWGIGCIIVAVLIATGYIGKWPGPAICGYWIGGAIYTTLAVGSFASTIHQPYLDGMRSPTLLMVFAVAFFGMSIGYSWQRGGRA